MLTVEQIEQIRRAYYCEHKSVRAIAREQGHGRRVIREAKPRPVMGPVAAIINGWLEQDRSAPRKQRHTAKRVFDRLVAEHGFAGSERQVREYVRAWKKANEGYTAFVPLSYSPGSEAQCDWGEALVRVAGVGQIAQLFCMRLAYSLKPFVCAFPTARQECFLAGHVAAFEAFGGVPRRITYDNLTTAVARVLSGRARVEQEAFIAFRGHYLFESHFCLPGREGAHEKPLVESLVGYARRNFLVPIPDVPSWEALNSLLSERCAAEDARTVSGRAGPVGELWHQEQALLLPLQRHTYPCCRTVAVRASRMALVSFERNRYSVPSRYAGERLLLRAFAWRVEITDGNAIVATHPRLYGKDGERLDPLHYLGVLEKKPGAFEHARPIRAWEREWPPVYRRYLEALKIARPEDATREFVRVLQLHTRHSEAVLAPALERALTLSCWSADGVEQLARQAMEPPLAARPIELGDSPALAHLTEIRIPLPDLAGFERLLGTEAGS